ncbi:hypothetical protein ABZ652_01140 [Micromonospora chalcea]|uniref:hypothetical protein n=1 Tax=Micromonospora chalcea TaxID=1874 RepID=UPI0033FDBE54
MTNLIDAILAELPDHQRLIAARAAVRARRDSADMRPATDHPTAAVQQQVLAAVLDGEPVPTDLRARIGAALLDEQMRGHEWEMLGRLMTNLEYEESALLSRNLDAILDALRERLDALLDETRAILAGPLADIRTSREASLAGRSREWGRIATLADLYRNIRAAQRTAIVKVHGDQWPTLDGHTSAGLVDDVLFLVGDIANLDEMWPDWHYSPGAWTGNPHAGRIAKATGNTAGTPPWPVQQGTVATPSRDRDYLVWLATDPTAKPWLPSMSEAADAANRQRAAGYLRQRREQASVYGEFMTDAEWSALATEAGEAA